MQSIRGPPPGLSQYAKTLPFKASDAPPLDHDLNELSDEFGMARIDDEPGRSTHQDDINQTSGTPEIEEVDTVALSSQNVLGQLFPTLGPTEIENLLIAYDYDLSAIITYMCSEADAVQPLNPSSSNVNQSSTSSIPPSTSTGVKQVCRHFLSGGCYRADCWFSHDLTAKVCKYWMEGLCVKGPSCPFWHGNPEELAQVTQSVVQSSQQKVQPGPPTQSATLNESHFPSLGNKPKPNKIDFWAPNYGSVTQQFASVSSPQSKFSSIKTTRKKNSSQKVKKVKDDDTPWLSTGDSAASTYMKHREEAIQVALDRNRLFQRATEAFLSGNKAAAKTFSLEARRLNDVLESLHLEASGKIFNERNARLGHDKGLIDLHGLHDKEAISQLSVFLSRASRGSSVKVVTGTGHHSRLGYSSLESAVKDYLSERGYRFAQAQRGDGMSGMYIVYLPS